MNTRQRVVGLLIGGAVLTASLPTHLAHGTGPAGPGADRILSLVDQSFAVTRGGVLSLRYELTSTIPGFDLDELAEPVPAGEPDGGVPGEGSADDDPTADEGTEDGDDHDDVGVEVFVTSYEPIVLRSRVQSVLAGAVGPAIDSARFRLADVVVPAEDPELPPQLVLDISTTTGGEVAAELVLPIAGLYPITVDLVSNGRRLERHVTFAERLTAPGQRPLRSQPYHLAIVAAIDDPGPEPDQLTLVDARSRLLEIAQLGEDLSGPLNVAIPPVVARSVADDHDLADRLAGALVGDEILALPEMQLDPSSAVRAGEADAFTRELREGEDILRGAIPAAAIRRTSWLVTEPLDPDGAAMLRDLGVQLLVMPLETYHQLEGSLPEDFTDPSLLYTTVVAGDVPMGVAVIDPVSALLDPDRSDGRTATEAAVALFAELSATRLQLPDATRVAILSTPRFAAPDADVLDQLERMVADHPAFSAQALSFVANVTDTFRSNDRPLEVVLPDRAGPDLGPRSQQLDEARLVTATVASMLPSDDPRPSDWNTDLDLWLSSAFGDAEIARRLSALGAAQQQIPLAIVHPEPFTFTLTGDTSDITFRLGNDGSVPLTVIVRATASKLTFPLGDQLIELAPGTNIIDIPVRTRSNGTFPVEIDLLTPTGQQRIGESIVLTARVYALTGLGQVLTGGALLVLATWWLSHLRGHRRARRAEDRERARNGHPSTRTDRVDVP